MKTYFYSIIILVIFIWTGRNNNATAQTPNGTPLLSQHLNTYSLFSKDGPQSMIEEVSVNGQSFNKALRVNTFNLQNLSGDLGITLPLTASVKKGDVLWLTFQSRCIKSTRESGEALLEVRLDELVNGKFEWPSFMERGLSVGSNWIQTSIPIEIKELPFRPKSSGDIIEPQNIRLVFRFDKYPQIIEIGPVTLINCGKVSVDDLPRSTVRYDGDAPDAAWRKQAQNRIEKIRKGDLSILVLDKNGNKVSNAKVAVRMQRNAFNWGTATNSSSLLDNCTNSKIYRDTLKQYFNQVVFENELKWKYWQKDTSHFDRTFNALKWLNENKITTRGHVMIWPSWKHSPKDLENLKNDTVALRKAIIDEIQFISKKFSGQFAQWDVMNEPTMHHQIIDILGKPEMVNWFKEARKGTPGTKLFLNDFTMFHKLENNGEGLSSDYFFNTLKYLKDNNAPIDGIGEQAHIGGTPPGIEFVLQRLDKFASFKLPIQITEFDIYSNDDDFKARYINDFMTAIYSHPSTTGFVQWGFWEKAHWLPISALWDKDWKIKKHGKVFTDLITKTWWTNFDGKTAANGLCNMRGFCGDYEITVTANGKTAKQNYSLSNNGGKIVVKL